MDQNQANTLLIFQVGPYSFCVSALEVESIISLPPITAIPFAPKSVAGTCLFHEKVALVISLHQKFGLKRNSDNDNDQLIVTQLESGLTAFWVDAVHDVTTSTDLQWEKISAAHSNSVFDRFLLKDGQVILHTSFESLYNLPDAAYVDGALEALASFAGKPEIAEQESTLDTGPPGTIKNEQIKNNSTIRADTSAQQYISKPNSDSPPLDIFDFETIPPSPGDLTSPLPGSINYSVDEHDAFDTDHIRKSAEKKLARSRTQKKPSIKHEEQTGTSSGTRKTSTIKPATHDRFFARKTGSPYQDRSNDFNPRRKSMTGWIYLIALLLAFAGAFSLWPPRPEQKKAVYYKKTYQIVAEKQQTQKDFYQDEKQYTPSKTTESKDVPISPAQKKEGGKIEHETVMQPSFSDTPRSDKSQATIQPPSETAFFEVGTENLAEQPTEPEPEPIAQKTIVEPTTFAEPEIVAPGSLASEEEKSEPVVTPNEKGEIYRVENKDFAIIVERPTKKEVLLIDEAPKKKKIFQEYIHIVIKGDTLWAIARKYLGDPFLYNKLAKNSEIKNPNLIYPGDRVRIIKKTTSP